MFVRSSTGAIELSLGFLSNRPPFDTDEARRDLLMRMKALPGVRIKTEKLYGWPSFPAARLLEDALWPRYCELAEEVITRLREAGSSTEGTSDLAVVGRASSLPAA
jgi:hypothetical protein